MENSIENDIRGIVARLQIANIGLTQVDVYVSRDAFNLLKEKFTTIEDDTIITIIEHNKTLNIINNGK